MATFPLTTPVADQQFEMRQTFAGEFVFVKNAYGAWILDDAAATPISDVDYPGYQTIAVTSITRSGSTATVTTTAPNTLETGDTVLISGAAETEYNGQFTIVVLTNATFTYQVTGTPATPATGTIVLQGGKTTVPGIVYLNDYIFVGTVKGEIQNCNRSAYTVWDALDFITPEKEPSLLVCIAKSLNYLVAFKEWDIEPFYDAEQPPPGSPLLPEGSAYLKLGCASAQSLVEFDGGIIFISKRDQLQRSREVHVLNGLTPQKVSSPEVERLLNASTLEQVYSLYLSTAGHQLYMLTLVDLDLTILYDFGTKFWYQVTLLTAQSAQTVQSIEAELIVTESVVTVNVANHGFEDGDPVLIAGASVDDYNGTYNISYVDENTFTYVIQGEVDSPPTGSITATGYDESYFPAVAYATYQNLDLVLHETNGLIYALDDELYEDTGTVSVPINALLRLPQWDNGNKERKTVSHAKPVGDLVDGVGLLRYTDDDYESYSKYRRVSMASQFAMVRKLGNTRRRAFEFRYTENTPLRVESIDMNFKQGR
jgi:hypothetical protein